MPFGWEVIFLLTLEICGETGVLRARNGSAQVLQARLIVASSFMSTMLRTWPVKPWGRTGQAMWESLALNAVGQDQSAEKILSFCKTGS